MANLAHCGHRAEEWRQLVEDVCLGPFLSKVEVFRFGLRVPLGAAVGHPHAFWEVALARLCHMLGRPMFTKNGTLCRRRRRFQP